MSRWSIFSRGLPGRFPAGLAAAAVATEAAFVAIALRSGAPRAEVLGWCGAAFAGYAAAVLACRRRAAPPAALVLGFAALFRLTLLAAPPMLSDDLYRYLWDGRVQVEGINPFLHPPGSDAVAGIDDALRARVNHPEVPTIYPPLSQIVFLAVAAVSPAVALLKTVLTLIEFAGILILWRLARTCNRSTTVLLLYAWNPLAVIEVAGNGHNDPIGVCLLLLAVWLILQKRPALSIASLGASFAAKLGSIPLAPFFLLAEGKRARWRVIPARAALLVAVPALLWLPYLPAGSSLWTGLRTYADRWRGNEFAFALLFRFYEWLEPADRLKNALTAVWFGSGDSALLQFLYRHVYPADLTKLTAVLLLGAVMIDLLRRRDELPRQVFLFLGWGLLLAPVLHPWYLLWILPFAALYGSPAWLAFSGLAFLSYLPGEAAAVGVTWVRLLEYLPFFALLNWGHSSLPGKGARPAGGTSPFSLE